MTPERLTEIYAYLSTATLTVDASTQRGPDYLQDQLQTCRRMQDAVVQIQIEVHRALAATKRGRRAARSLVALHKKHPESVGYTAARDDLDQLEGAHDDLVGLMASVSVARGNLRATDSDIRLSATLMELQVRLGVIRPATADQPLVSVTPISPPAAPLAVAGDEELQAFYASLS